MQKREMVEEEQRDHLKPVYDETEERQKKEKESKISETPRSEANLGEVWEVVLSPSDGEAELAMRQCCSRRATQNRGSDKDATRRAPRKQLDGGNTKKVEAAKRRRQK